MVVHVAAAIPGGAKRWKRTGDVGRQPGGAQQEQEE